MKGKDPIARRAAAVLRRQWDAPHVRRMVATSAELGATGSIDNTENLS